jgi:predicted nucleic acid-binding protein
MRPRRTQDLAEDTFDQLPFDLSVARVSGRIYAAVIAAERETPGRRTMDLLIAATALSNKLPLYTHNVDDFTGLEELLEIVAVPDSAAPPGRGVI